MLFEFIGCSGAGKTTLLNKVTEILNNQGHDVISSTTKISQIFHVVWVRNESVRNLLYNFLLF